MSSFSKKYISVKDESNQLFLTWETGYRNLKIYHEGTLIHTIESPGRLTSGVTFEHNDLGSIQVNLSTTSPMIIELKVGKQKYFAESLKENFKKEAFSGLVSIFWTMSGLALISALFVQFNFGLNLDNPLVLIQLIFDIVIIAIYVLSAIFLSRRQIWAYYLGGITFLLLTLLYVYIGAMSSFNFFSILIIAVRAAILFYIIRSYNDVIMSKKSVVLTDSEILDNNDIAELDF